MFCDTVIFASLTSAVAAFLVTFVLRVPKSGHAREFFFGKFRNDLHLCIPDVAYFIYFLRGTPVCLGASRTLAATHGVAWARQPMKTAAIYAFFSATATSHKSFSGWVSSKVTVF